MIFSLRSSSAALLALGTSFGLMACSSTASKTDAKSPPAVAAAAASTSQEVKPQAANAAAPAKPEAGSVVAATERECKRSEEVRKLSVEKIEPKGCKLHYEKPGSKSIVASSAIGTSHCESVEKRIRENLSAAGFKCTE